jgi:hypothetical protein
MQRLVQSGICFHSAAISTQDCRKIFRARGKVWSETVVFSLGWHLADNVLEHLARVWTVLEEL